MNGFADCSKARTPTPPRKNKNRTRQSQSTGRPSKTCWSVWQPSATDERRKDFADGDLEAQWGFGDWLYHAINYDDAWVQAWGDIELAIANASNMLSNNRKYREMELLCHAFLEMASRAVLRVAQSESVARLNRTADFQVLCVDHDEGPLEAFARFEAMRDSRT